MPSHSGAEESRDATNAKPLDLRIRLVEQRLRIIWNDGVESEYDLAALRRDCPCATCRTEREERVNAQNPFNILKRDPARVRANGAQLVGHYAIQFEWADGHNTGIYDFRYLRGLAEK